MLAMRMARFFSMLELLLQVQSAVLESADSVLLQVQSDTLFARQSHDYDYDWTRQPKVCCSLKHGSSKNVPREAIHSVAFAIAPEKWSNTSSLRRDGAKTTMFSPLIPGQRDTYIYHTEDAYYTQYSKALFGITMRKGGWDCFRHYEIIMSGSIPFFISLEDMPNRTMTNFPRALTASAMALPGVPSQAEVKESMAKGQVPQVNLEQFDMKAYMTIRNQLMEYAAQNLLTTSTASKVVPQKVMQKVLVHSRVPEVGYGQFVLVNGLVNNGHSVCARPEGMLDTMRDDDAGALDTAYGGGFSYARTVDHTKLARDCHGPWDYYLLLAEGGEDYPEPYSEDTKQANNIFAINFDDRIQASLRAPAVATEYFVREL